METWRDRAGAVCGADPEVAARVPQPGETGMAGLERAALRLGALGGLSERLGGGAAPAATSLLLCEMLLAASAPAPAAPAAPRRLSPILRDLLICDALPPGDRRPPEALRRLGNTVRAAEIGLRAVTARGHAAFDVSLLRAMHAALCEALAVPGQGGVLRPALTGGSVEGALAAILSGLASPDESTPLLLRMAQLGAGFAELAPFEFGSPALARLLPALLAACEGFAPVVVAPIPASRDASGLQPYFDAVALAAWQAQRLSSDIAQLREDWLRRLLTLRSDANARRLVGLLIEQPVVTAGEAGKWLGVSFQTANAAVATLVAHDILAPLGGLRRNRVFVATEMFATENESPPLAAPIGASGIATADRAAASAPFGLRLAVLPPAGR